MKKLLLYAIPLVLLIYFGFFFYVQNSGATQGELAPDFEAEIVDGGTFKLSELKGKYVLLDFWASWCGPCLRDIPKLQALQKKYPNKLVLVSIALEKNAESGKKASAHYGLSWEHQVVEQHKFVMLSDIARKYGVSEIPSKFLISPEGKLLPKMSFVEMDKMLGR